MKPPHLAPRDRRAVALGAAVIAAAWLGTRAVPAVLRAHEAARARTEASLRALIRAREALTEAPWVKDSLAARARQLVAWAPRLVAGGTGAEATAELQSLVMGIAAQRRVRIVRVEPHALPGAGDFGRVALRVEAQGDVTGIAGWLAAMEEGDHLLTISQLLLSNPDPAAPLAQPEALRAELVVAGWAVPKPRRR